MGRLPFSKTYLGRVWLQSPTVMLLKVNMCLKASQRAEKLMRLTALKLLKVVLSGRRTPRQAEVHLSHLYRTTDRIGVHESRLQKRFHNKTLSRTCLPHSK